MNPQFTILFAVAGMILVTFVFMAIWASRFAKVGPNQVLIVSGRKYPLPDGKLDVLSLEVLTIEMSKCKVPAAKGVPTGADCVAQVKIRGDDISLFSAIEHFLSKKEEEIKNIIWLVLEKHLRSVFGNLSVEEIRQGLGACASRVEAAASTDLGNMGVGIVSFTIRDVSGG